MEDQQGLPGEWVLLEYSQICQEILSASAQNAVLFTSLSEPLKVSLSESLSAKFPACECLSKGIDQLVQEDRFPSQRVCLLDPKAVKELSPEDGSLFDVFLFGGILGDDPPRDRTGELRKLGYSGRHLGSKQMTTDTAVIVSQRIIQNQVCLPDLDYVDDPVIKFNEHESTEMPFRYLVKDGRPMLPNGMKELLYKDMDKAFEF